MHPPCAGRTQLPAYVEAIRVRDVYAGWEKVFGHVAVLSTVRLGSALDRARFGVLK